MNTKRRLYPKPKKYGEPWYSGVHYTYSQSFPTFARLTSGRKYLSNLLQRLVKEPANTTALEIGPGLSPLTTLLPFKKVFFLEKSKAVADDLGYSKIKKRVNYRRVVEDRIKDSSFENSRVIVGDLRALPFGLKTSFGVIIMNEVLTHVIPSERLSVIAELAEKTDRILLVDRKLMPLEELKRSHIEYAKKVCKEDRIFDVIGGFHLVNPDKELIDKTVEYFSDIKPTNVHACHCTDFKSKVALSKAVNLQEVGVGLTLEYK